MTEYNLEKCTITVGGVDLSEFVHGDLLTVTIRLTKTDVWRRRWIEFRARAAHYKARMRRRVKIRKFWSCGSLYEQATFPNPTTPTRDDRPDAMFWGWAIWAGVGERS